MGRKTLFILEEQNLDRFRRTGVWIHEHPTIIKVVQIAGLIIGIGLLISFPFIASLVGRNFVVAISITGVFLTLVCSITLFALDVINPPHHDMKNHVYTEKIYESGRLYYDGDVPILTLDCSDPFKAGKAQGYLCGEAICHLAKRISFILHMLGIQPKSDKLPKTIAAMREVIPSKYLSEIEGLVAGYNEWAKEQHWWKLAKKLTVDEVLLFHLIPDSIHFQPKVFEHRLEHMKPMAAVACSVIVDKDSKGRLVFARNLDWPSFGLGRDGLVISRQCAEYSTVDIAVPGFVGALTGMNDRGLLLAMNVCEGDTEEVRGMPAVFYNRACLEECGNLQDVENFVRKKSPLGAYHLTVADRKGAESIHFYQSPENTHVIRRWEEGKPLVTLNCCYSPEPNMHMYYSMERWLEIDAFLKDRRQRPLEDVLAISPVNNLITVQRIVMVPKERLGVALGDSYTGEEPLREVDIRRFI